MTRVKRPLAIRLGESLLLFVFVALLAGRFTLARLEQGVEAEGFDLRWLSVGVGAFAILFWFGGGREYLPRRVSMFGMIPFLAWCAWMTTSAQWAPVGARTTETMLDFGFMAILVLMAWLVMSMLPAESLERVWTWLLVTGLVYFVLALASGPDTQGRFAAPGGGSNTFVRIMIAAAIAALYLAAVKGKNWALLTIPVFAVGAALSGSRGGLLSAVVVMLVFVVPVLRRLGFRRFVGLGFAAIVGAGVASLWRDGYLVQYIQDRFIRQTLIEGYSSGRDVISEQAWAMFASYPFAGVGLDGFFPLQVNGTVAYEHPHNLVLSSLAEAGLIGGVLLLVAILRLVSVSLGSRMRTSVLFALLTGLYFFGTSLFSGDYYDSRFMWFFLALAATAACRARRDTPGAARVKSRQPHWPVDYANGVRAPVPSSYPLSSRRRSPSA